MPTDETIMIGIFSFINAPLTPFVVVVGDGVDDASAASMLIAACSAGVGVVAPLLVWLSRTLTKSACAEAGFVVDSNCTYGAAVLLVFPSTKSP